MTKTNTKEDTVNKSLLLNWLYSADKDLRIKDLGKWIEAKTNGKYKLTEEVLDLEDQTKSVDKP